MGAGGESEARGGLVRAFTRDLRWSVGAWKIDPRLPIAGLSLSVCQVALFAAPRGSTANHVLVFPGMAFMLFFAGFHGVERVWYDRIGLGWNFAWNEVRKCNGDMRSRFVRTGLVLVPLALLTAPFQHSSPALRYGVAGSTWFVADVLLTFVTVELALVTSSAREAIETGLSLLRTTWPACALYALLPPFALQLVFQTGAGFGTMSRLVAGIAIAPIALAFRGATVRFFDREVRVLSLHP